MKLAITIPFFNESLTIIKTLSSYVPLFSRFPNSFFVLVDNGSTDDSLICVKAFLSDYPNIHAILLHESHKGVQFARTKALDEAVLHDPDIIFSTDADTIFLVEKLDTFCQELLSFVDSASGVFAGEGSIDKRLYIKRLFYFKPYVEIKRSIWNLFFQIFGPYFFGAFFGMKPDVYRSARKYYHPESLSGEGEDLLLSRICFYTGADFWQSTETYVETSPRRFLDNPFLWIIGAREKIDVRRIFFQSKMKKFARMRKRMTEQDDSITTLIIRHAHKRLWRSFLEAYTFHKETHGIYPRSKEAMVRFFDFFHIPYRKELLEHAGDYEKQQWKKVFWKEGPSLLSLYIKEVKKKKEL